jgi:hypothetical protein
VTESRIATISVIDLDNREPAFFNLSLARIGIVKNPLKRLRLYSLALIISRGYQKNSTAINQWNESFQGGVCDLWT